jgi:2-(1,2-epoxy-1,2-dihydrophenyl)acetyl-CoA isomerase
MSNQLVKTAREGPVLVVRLNSPENRNSLTTELRQQLGEAVGRPTATRRYARCT